MRRVCDSRGTRITPGARVAYNRSGDVIEGVVERIAPNTVIVRPLPEFVWRGPADPVSRVRNPRGILVLDD